MTGQPPRLSVGLIQQRVAMAYGLDVRLLTSPRRARKVARPRQVAMWLCAKLLPGYSLPEIGRAFGNRDHTTIMHGIRRVEALSDHDPAFFETLVIIRDRIIDETTVQPVNQVSIERQARDLAQTFTNAAYALAEANPDLAARVFRRIGTSFKTHQSPKGSSR
jgi:chromosomal replication initiator protein